MYNAVRITWLLSALTSAPHAFYVSGDFSGMGDRTPKQKDADAVCATH